MQERTFKKISIVLSWVLFLVSFYLTFLTLSSFAVWGSLQFYGWTVLAIVIAILQLSFIIEIKTAWANNSSNWKKGFLIFGYTIFTLITYTGSLLFSVSTVEGRSAKVSSTSKDFSEEIEKIEERIGFLEEENKNYQSTIDTYLLKNQVFLSKGIMVYKEANENKIKEYETAIKNIKLESNKEDSQEVVTNLTFDKIASIFHMSGTAYQYILLILISLGVEFGLFITTEPLTKGSFITNNAEVKKDLIKYINALFDTDGTRLISDKKIEEITKIPLKTCFKYKRFLLEQYYNGKQLLTSGKGGTKSNFSKEDITRIITFLLNTNKEII